MTAEFKPRKKRSDAIVGVFIIPPMVTTPDLDKGACRIKDDINPDIFLSDKNKDIELAKSICNECPQKEPCLIFAIQTRAEGVWGGTTQDERRAHGRTLLNLIAVNNLSPNK